MQFNVTWPEDVRGEIWPNCMQMCPEWGSVEHEDWRRYWQRDLYCTCSVKLLRWMALSLLHIWNMTASQEEQNGIICLLTHKRGRNEEKANDCKHNGWFVNIQGEVIQNFLRYLPPLTPRCCSCPSTVYEFKLHSTYGTRVTRQQTGNDNSEKHVSEHQ